MRVLAAIGLIAIVVAVAAAAFFLGGYYSVAASQAEPDLVAAALIRVRNASIDRHATELPPMPLDDPATVQAGARVFLERGCANCHGAPGVGWAKFSEGMNPGPPDLKDVVGGLEPRHLFWVVRNGIDMTGMPAFGPIGVPDKDIWSIVAYLKKLPGVTDQDFKAWTASGEAKP
jgi:mono/diheme cytochrome c family protein